MHGVGGLLFGKRNWVQEGLSSYSMADVASTNDYSDATNIDDGVVDKPPSGGPLSTFAESLSPLWTQTWTSSVWKRSLSTSHDDPPACRLFSRICMIMLSFRPQLTVRHLLLRMWSKMECLVCLQGPWVLLLAPMKDLKTQKVPLTLSPLISVHGKRLKGDGTRRDHHSSLKPYCGSNGWF